MKVSHALCVSHVTEIFFPSLPFEVFPGTDYQILLIGGPPDKVVLAIPSIIPQARPPTGVAQGLRASK